MKNKESTYEIKWVNHSTWSDKFVITVFRSGTKNRISNIFHLIPTPNDVVFSSFQNRFRNIFWTQSFYSDTLFVLLLDKMRWDDICRYSRIHIAEKCHFSIGLEGNFKFQVQTESSRVYRRSSSQNSVGLFKWNWSLIVINQQFAFHFTLRWYTIVIIMSVHDRVSFRIRFCCVGFFFIGFSVFRIFIGSFETSKETNAMKMSPSMT